MKTRMSTGRVLVTGAVVVTAAFFVSACDVAIGPPVQVVGFEHNVGPAQPGYCGQVVRNGSPPKCSVHSSRVRSRPTARQANSTALSLDRSQS